MCGKCGKDIHECHAELTHPARDIQFQIAYDNAGSPASITDINQKNAQSALESYFSQQGIRISNEEPSGAKNNTNLVYTVSFEFIPGTLEVCLSGDKLDAGVDFVEAGDSQGFTVVLDPTDPNRLNSPPLQNESLRVNYLKRITFDTKGGT